MLEVIKKWPVTCEHHLTDKNSNRRAFVGHAAAAMHLNLPEYITRMAWGKLSTTQQDLANQKADEAIYLWEKLYEHRKSVSIHKQMEVTRL